MYLIVHCPAPGINPVPAIALDSYLTDLANLLDLHHYLG